MENVCADSPMFDFVEQAAGKEVRAPLDIRQEQAIQEASGEGGPKAKESQADRLAQFVSQFEGDFAEVEFDEANENVTVRDLARMSLTVQDGQMVK